MGNKVVISQDAIDEVAAHTDFRQHGPKDETKCPDCGATVRIHQLDNGRYEIQHVKHAS